MSSDAHATSDVSTSGNGDNVEERLEQIEDVDCMQVVDAHCEDESLKDTDDFKCTHILDGDCGCVCAT